MDKTAAIYESFTGYPSYVTAFSPSRRCRVFCDTGEPVPPRKYRPKPLNHEPWKVGKITNEEDDTLITSEESRRNYKEWIIRGCNPPHPNTHHHPDICPGCFASLDHCSCQKKDKKKPGLALALGSYRLIDTNLIWGYS
jgi:hypothetical protein